MLSGGRDPKREKGNSNVFCTPKRRRQGGGAQKFSIKKEIIAGSDLGSWYKTRTAVARDV